MRKLLLSFLFLSLFSSLLSAQEYITNVRHYDFEKGLESRDIRSALKDSQGFMWFTSENGAYRFDGYQFKNYRRRIDGDNPYAMGYINEDSEQNLWFHHHLIGLNEIDLSILPAGQDSLISFDDFFKENLPCTTKDISKIVFKHPNFIGLFCKDGKAYEYKDGKFINFFQIPNVSFHLQNNIKLPHIDISSNPDGTYCIVFKDQFYAVANKKIIAQEVLPMKGLNIKIDKQEKIWFQFYENVFFKDSISAPIRPYSLLYDKSFRRHFLYSMSSFYSNYVLTSNSTSIYDLKLYDIKEDTAINIEPFGIPETNISPQSYFIENKNSIWLTTHDGIYHIQLNKNVFKNYLQGESTRKITKSKDGNLWVTSNSGFHKIDLANESSPPTTFEKWRHGRNLYWENDNELWLGKLYHRIEKINITNLESIKQYTFHNPSPSTQDVNFLQRDKKANHLWLGTTTGLHRYDEQQDSFLFFKNSPKYSEFDLVQAYDFFENENLILLATFKGIQEFNPLEGIIQSFSTKNNALPYDNIIFIHQDKEDDTFWLGTKLGGLIHWDKKNGTFETFTTKDGLSDDLIYSIYEDEDGFLWMSSNQGLMRFNKKTKDVLTFSTKDGLPYDEFNYYSHYQDEEGNLYFGGLNGITTFHPRDLNINPKETPLKITDFEIFNSEKGKMISHWKEFKNSKNIVLQPSEKYFRLTMALLDFKYPEANQFSYHIDGLENDWKKIQGNIIEINDLPYGSFNLKIKAKDSNNFWSEEFLEIPIVVQKPIYMKWWFLVASAILLASLIRFFIFLRTNNLQKEKEKLELEVAKRTEVIEKDKAVIERQAEELKKLDKVKTQFFANVTHELRTPLTLIIGPLKQLMKSNTLDDKTIRTLTAIAQNGEQLKNLVEEILDLSRYDANKLEVNKRTVHFLREVRNWATGFDLDAQQRGIEFQVEYQLPIDLHLKVDNKKLEKIINNLLSNAFKHTQSGDVITFKISENDNHILLQVIDTGAGIHKKDLPHIFKRFYQINQSDSQLHGGLGIGLALSKELANLMDGKLSVESTLGQGSIFTLEILKEVSEEINLSMEKDDGQVVDTKEHLLQSIQSKSKKNILIVEDNASMQVFIQELLYPFANLTIANNGKDALRILENPTAQFSLIISDVMMPEMDGFTLLEKLKNDKAFQFVPTIMLTALGDIDHKLKALRIGVDDYLVKPFEPEELIVRVNNLLENIEMRKEETVLANDFEIEKELPELESANMKWLKELEEVAFENCTKPNFNVSQLAHEVALGERQLNRKLKKLIGLTPGNYLKEIKLQKARQLLESKAYSTVAEISYLIGFSTPEYFSKVFKKRFGKLPKDYLK